MTPPDATADERLKAMQLGIEITNHAVQDIPEELVRYHHGWGRDTRPHVFDVAPRDQCTCCSRSRRR